MAALYQARALSLYRSIQSGVAASAGNIVISAVTIARCVVVCVSKGSAGTVQTNSGFTLQTTYGEALGGNTAAINANQNSAGTLSGGTTDLFTKQYSGRVTTPTQLTVDGPCEWCVLETWA